MLGGEVKVDTSTSHLCKGAYMTKFVIYPDVSGYYRWRLVAANGEKVAASEAYVSKQNAVRSAERVKQIAYSAMIVE
jgi:uncharacterized protein YegP (UPF0339 family)